jgi:hypothetical protein
MPDERNRYDGKHSEGTGLPPGEVERDPRTHHADPVVATGDISQRDADRPLNPSAMEPDSQERQDRDELADQMEEFEGPDRREIRGGPHREPDDDPGVAHS